MSNPAPFGQSPEASVLKPDATSTTAFNGLVDQWLDIQSNPAVQAITGSPLTQFAAYDAAWATGGALGGAAVGSGLGYGLGRTFGLPLGMFASAASNGRISPLAFEADLTSAATSMIGRSFALRGALAGAAIYGLYEAGKWAYNKISE